MLRVLFVDFNSYFASVEQQLRPELRGRPVAVVPVRADTTCCIAASYEARAFGVRTGTRVGDARRMCPGLRIVEARHGRYVAFHNELVELIDTLIPVERVLSIDEMACALIPRYREREAALSLAGRIKREIRERVGECMRCSIGVAPNIFLGKTASDMQKPDGLVVIEEKDLPQILYPLKLRDFSGIGANMENRLRSQGINTVRELCALDRREMRAVWGSVDGERYYDMLRGVEPAERGVRQRSVSHSNVLSPELRNERDAFAVLSRLLQKAAARLRHEEFLCGELVVSVKYGRDKVWADSLHLQETDDSMELLRFMEQLWQRRPRKYGKPYYVGVVIGRLVQRNNYTPQLFQAPARRQESLNRALDTLNERFGKHAVYFGSAHEAMESASMRIAFNRIPNLDLEGDE
jgi:DNA polymerase-4